MKKLLIILFLNFIPLKNLLQRPSEHLKEINFITLRTNVVNATCYLPDRKNHTADRTKVPRRQRRWVAISRDMLKQFPFNSVILVEGADIYDGKWIVKDLMNKRHLKSIDFMVIDTKKYTLDSWKQVKITLIN